MKKTNLNIDTFIEVLMALNMDFTISHTNDYSEMTVRSNNSLVGSFVLFDCGDRSIFKIGFSGCEDK